MASTARMNKIDTERDVVEVLQAAGLENRKVAVAWRGHIPPRLTLHQLCTSLSQDNKYARLNPM